MAASSSSHLDDFLVDVSKPGDLIMYRDEGNEGGYLPLLYFRDGSDNTVFSWTVLNVKGKWLYSSVIFFSKEDPEKITFTPFFCLQIYY